MAAIRTVLYPTDLTGSCDAARQLACALARDSGARLIVLYAYPYPVGLDDVAERRATGYEAKVLERLQDLVPDDRTVAVEYRVAEGHPTDAILETAAREGCDLIVLGTHGRGGIRRVLMGSVAEEVSRRAGCPVAVVRPAACLPQELPEEAGVAGARPDEPQFELGVAD